MPHSQITIGFASHRLETLPAFLAAGKRCRAVVLEEPPESDFPALLAGALPPAAYFEDKDLQFPEFALAQAEALMDLHRQGVAVLQVEPYLQRLVRIHELLAQGRLRAEVEVIPELAPVYAAEHRAAALARLAPAWQSLYVEAGYIHLYLLKALKKHLGDRVRLHPLFLQGPASRAAIGLPRPLGPGDLLTLLFIFGSPLSRERADLLAARSLIHIQLLGKMELPPTPAAPTPHLDDEIRAWRLTRALSFADCAGLYPRVRQSTPATARRLVAANRENKGE